MYDSTCCLSWSLSSVSLAISFRSCVTFWTSLSPPWMRKVRSSWPVSRVLMSTLYSVLIFRILSPPLPMIFAAVVRWVLNFPVTFPCSWGSSWSLALKVILRFCLLDVPASAVSIASAIFSAMISAVSLVMWSPSGFIWPLWMVIASVRAMAVPWRSVRISFRISVSLLWLLRLLALGSLPCACC